jgi:hypothetical protein
MKPVRAWWQEPALDVLKGSAKLGTTPRANDATAKTGSWLPLDTSRQHSVTSPSGMQRRGSHETFGTGFGTDEGFSRASSGSYYSDVPAGDDGVLQSSPVLRADATYAQQSRKHSRTSVSSPSYRFHGTHVCLCVSVRARARYWYVYVSICTCMCVYIYI